MDQVNEARTGPSLTENATLDNFAALRFKDASANYSISDYGFGSDVASFFGQNVSKPYVEELLLYPGTYTPSAYASFLSAYALRHWSGLKNLTFTHYEYYVGHSAYYDVYLPCSVNEIPRPGINITQYFQAQGCKTIIQPGVTWLVIVLST